MFTFMARALFLGGPPPGFAAFTQLDAMNAVLTGYTAEQLAEYVERLWERPRLAAGLTRNLAPDGNDAVHRSWSLDLRTPAIFARGANRAPSPPQQGYWFHIAYAYMLECTNLVRVFERVVAEWNGGERLPFANDETHRWLRTTEQLFFTTPLPPSIQSLASDLRRDREAIRRNAYYRFLGVDLPHGTADGRAFSYHKSDIANREFVRAFEELLKITWAAFMNRRNLIGANATDEQALAELVREIRQMLTARRNGGALSREEFDAVVYMSWFDLALFDNTVVVENLNAQSTSSALRLRKIADRVGVPVHAKADSFFQMAMPMALVLDAIEAGLVDDPNTDRLYLGNGAIARSMRLINTHWSITTGRSVKGVDVAALPATRAVPPLPAPVPAAVAVLPGSRFEVLAR